MQRLIRPEFSFIAVLLFVASIPAVGQTVVCSRSMIAQSCDRLAVPIENELRRLGAPSGWTWVVLDTADWRQASRMFQAEGQTGTGFTVRDLKTVFLNGEYVLSLRPQLPTRTLSHELGHILCRCGSEIVANKIASDLRAGYGADTRTTQAKPEVIGNP